MESGTPQTLAYANQPINENLIVSTRPSGVTIRVLPSRRGVRSASGKLVLFAGIAALLFAVSRSAAQAGAESWFGAIAGLAMGVGALVAGGMGLVRAHSPFELDADASGLTRTRWLTVLGRNRRRQVSHWPRERITDLVATRLPEAIWSAEPPYYLQLRLTDGTSESLGSGSALEARWLGALLTVALSQQPAAPVQQPSQVIPPTVS